MYGDTYGDQGHGEEGVPPVEGAPVEAPAEVSATPAGEPGTFAPSADGTPATEADASNIPAKDAPVS